MALTGSILNAAKIAVVGLGLLWLQLSWNYPGWGSPRASVVNAAAGSLGILTVAALWGRLGRSGRPALTWPILAVVGATGVTTIFSTVPGISLSRLWATTAAGSIYWLAAGLLTKRQIERGLLLGGWIALALGALDAGYILQEGGRAAIWGNSNTGAMLLAGLAPVGWLVLRNKAARWAWLILAVVGVLATGSRAGAVSLVAGLAVAQGLPWWAVGLVAGCGLPLSVLRPTSLEHRLDLWQGAIRAWLDRPITGTGPGTAITWAWGVADNGFWHAHSTILTTLSEGGLVGMAASTWLAIRLYVRRAGWPWAVLVALGVYGLFDDPFLFGGPSWLAILAAVCLSQSCGIAVAERVGPGV